MNRFAGGLAPLVLSCFLVLHSPDGSRLLVQGELVRVIKPVHEQHRRLVAASIRSMLYLGPNGFGVTETEDQILGMIKGCEK